MWLQRASQHFKTAHQLQPDYPEVATALISVNSENIGSSSRPDTARYWFDRAAEACFDWRPAYKELFWILHPRWGGSYARIFSFGSECADTGWYDTMVPYYLVQAAAEIRYSMGYEERRTSAFPSRKEVKQLKVVLENYADQTEDSHQRDFYFSELVVLSYLARWPETLEHAWDSLGRFNRSACVKYQFFDIDKKKIAKVLAESSPATSLLSTASTARDEGNYDKAKKLYATARQLLENKTLARSHVDNELVTLLWENQFHRNEPVHLKVDETLSGWRPRFGEWTSAGDDTLRGKSIDRTGLVCFINFPVGRQFTLDMNVNFADSPYSYALGGLLFTFRNGARSALDGVFLEFGGNHLTYFDMDEIHRVVERSIERQTAVRYQMWDKQLAVFIDEEMVWHGSVLSDFGPDRLFSTPSHLC